MVVESNRSKRGGPLSASAISRVVRNVTWCSASSWVFITWPSRFVHQTARDDVSLRQRGGPLNPQQFVGIVEHRGGFIRAGRHVDIGDLIEADHQAFQVPVFAGLHGLGGKRFFGGFEAADARLPTGSKFA